MNSPIGGSHVGDRVRGVPSTLSRRTVLRATGVLGAAGLLAACTSPGGGSSSGGRSTVKVWTVPEGPSDEEFQRAQFDLFMEANPDIDVELQFFAPDAYANAVQLAYTGGGGDAPDVFRQSGAGGLLLRDLQRRGWIQPLNEFITDDFTSRFPDWVFAENSSPLYVDGEAYGVPRPDPRVQALRPLYYNVDVLEQFGFDGPPATWSEMREMATKITTDGNREVYGTAGLQFLTLQRFAGPKPYGGESDAAINLLTGEPMASHESFADVVELGQSLQRDEIFTPGWEAWAPTDAVQQMAVGRLGFYMFPIFHANEIRRANPDLRLGVAPPPMPDGGRVGSLTPSSSVLGFWFMSSESKAPEASWRVLDFLGSLDFQRAAFESERQISVMPAVYEGIEVDPDTEAFLAMGQDLVRTPPDPFRVDPASEEFYAKLSESAPRPTVKQLVEDSIKDPSMDYAALASAYDDDLRTVIDEVLGEGIIDSMDAFVYPDWDPMEDYVTG